MRRCLRELLLRANLDRPAALPTIASTSPQCPPEQPLRRPSRRSDTRFCRIPGLSSRARKTYFPVAGVFRSNWVQALPRSKRVGPRSGQRAEQTAVNWPDGRHTARFAALRGGALLVSSSTAGWEGGTQVAANAARASDPRAAPFACAV